MGFATKVFASAVDYWNAFDPEAEGCLILDVHAHVDGRLLQELLAERPISPPVVMISGTLEVQHVVRAMRRGAVDFLQKRSYSELELWEALQRALALDVVRRDEFKSVRTSREKFNSLTDPERQVLRRLLQGENNREIADHFGISRAAVEARRIRLMRKLGVDNLVSLVNLAITAQFQ